MPKASKIYVFCPGFFSAFYMPISKYLLVFCILCWQFSICHYKSSPHSFPSYLWPGKLYSVEYWPPLPPDFLMDLANERHCDRLKKTRERDQGIISANLSGYLLLPAVKRFASSWIHYFHGSCEAASLLGLCLQLNTSKVFFPLAFRSMRW